MLCSTTGLLTERIRTSPRRLRTPESYPQFDGNWLSMGHETQRGSNHCSVARLMHSCRISGPTSAPSFEHRRRRYPLRGMKYVGYTYWGVVLLLSFPSSFEGSLPGSSARTSAAPTRKHRDVLSDIRSTRRNVTYWGVDAYYTPL